jgi:uncharacterized protein (TIGR03435 family)
MLKSFLRTISALLALAAGTAFSQTPAPAPAFEVASVKPAGPLNPALIASGQMRIGMKIDKARVDIGSLSLADLIRTAYRVKPYQISGPEWMAAERFDVQAKLPEGASPDLVPEMLQALLAERFKLAMHRESKEQAVYALVVGKNGAKLKESAPDADAPAGDGVSAPAGAPTGVMAGNGQVRISGSMDGKGVTVTGGPAGTMRMSMGEGGTMRMENSKMPLATLADMLSRFVDRPVVDMTELKGNYQVTLELSIADLRNMARTAGVMIPGPAAGGDAGRSAPEAASDPSSPSIFAAVQQLGLKLESRKTPVELIVIDHLEKTPTEN